MLIDCRKLDSLQKSLNESANKSARLEELLQQTKDENSKQVEELNTQHEKITSGLKADLSELVSMTGDCKASWCKFLKSCIC